MFKIHYVTAIFIISSYAALYSANSTPLTCDAARIATRFIDLSLITQIYHLKNEIGGLLFGRLQSDRTRKGDYIFEDAHYSVQGLKEQEALLEQNKGNISHEEYAEKKATLMVLLEKAKNSFTNKNQHFRSVGNPNTKELMKPLVRESLKNHNRTDSLLVSWTVSKSDKDEEKIFHEEVLSFKVFEEFLTDLYNFLGDLIESCPEINRQYQEQVKKFIIVRKLSSSCLPKESLKPFLSYVKNTYLEKLRQEEITPEKIQSLYESYLKSKK